MKSFRDHIISLSVIFILISLGWKLANAATSNEAALKTEKLSVSKTQSMKINEDIIKNSINAFQNLSEDKKVALKERMAQLSQKRQQDIKEVEKLINEYKLQKQLQYITEAQETQINQLQAIQKIALKENATETAKSLEIFISWYENKQKIKTLENDRIKVE